MTEYEAKRDPNRCPTHPGALLRKTILPHLDMTHEQFAASIGLSRQQLSKILHERAAISPHVALKLEKLLGNSARFWLNMQSAHDLWHARQTTDLSKIKTLKVA